MTVDSSQLFKMRIHIALCHELVSQNLCPDICVNIVDLLADDHLVDDLLWSADIANSDSGGKYL